MKQSQLPTRYKQKLNLASFFAARTPSFLTSGELRLTLHSHLNVRLSHNEWSQVEEGGKVAHLALPTSRVLEAFVDNLHCPASVERDVSKEIHQTTHQGGGIGDSGIGRGSDLTGENNARLVGIGTEIKNEINVVDRGRPPIPQ